MGVVVIRVQTINRCPLKPRASLCFQNDPRFAHERLGAAKCSAIPAADDEPAVTCVIGPARGHGLGVNAVVRATVEVAEPAILSAAARKIVDRAGQFRRFLR